MFRDYCELHATDNTPAGDFCADYLRQPMPAEPNRWPELRRFLAGRGADLAVLEAARAAWLDYAGIAPSAPPR